MVALAQPCEGPDTATVTISNCDRGDQLDQVTIGGSGTITFDSTHARAKTAIKVVGDAAANNFFGWVASLGTQGTIYGRLYCYFTGNPAANTSLVRPRNGTNQVARILVDTTGNIELRNAANGALGTSTNTISTGQFVRIEFKVIALAVGGTVEVKLYNSPDSTTATETLTATGAALLNDVTDCLFGVVAGPTGSVWFDDLNVNTTGYPGPVASDAPYQPLRRRAHLLVR